MIPGMNPRQMQAAMRRMGIKQEELDATEVIIRTKDKEIIILNPNVAKVNMMGQTTYQISGEETEQGVSPKINDDDIKMVADQTGVDLEKAKGALEKSDGDLAKAIVDLKS
ncbi:nascent polypeptide-associated complex protein [archaeon]|nr:nascent polypeptide-associated complex protein [archaeon]|tara:strand:+ start:765 stop:1097 length:333 start_codon:yes stop_codon:yes gene_type:complete